MTKGPDYRLGIHVGGTFTDLVVHHVDVWGRAPGNMAHDSRDTYQEGLRTPPLKLHDRGHPNKTLFRLIEDGGGQWPPKQDLVPGESCAGAPRL